MMIDFAKPNLASYEVALIWYMVSFSGRKNYKRVSD